MRPIVFIITIAAAAPGLAQESITAFATRASVQALTFKQADPDAFKVSRGAFTPAGWTAFQAEMVSWVDQNGAPQFGSTFVPTGNARIVDEQGGVAHVRIPGTLTQTQEQARTTYSRFAVDVWISGDPHRIEKLKQTTCLGTSTECQ